ncbi:MAG: phosphatase PAP2 family protein [Acidimicrobiales bacterium]
MADLDLDPSSSRMRPPAEASDRFDRSGGAPRDRDRRDRGRSAGFPLSWRDLGLAVLYLFGVIAAGSLIGKVLVDWTAPNAVTDYDLRLARELVADRTSQLNDAAMIGSLLSSTVVKIIATLIIAAVMAVLWRRWHEPVFVIGTLLFEAGAFVAITHIVLRPRPPVEQLEGSSIGSSFPSGHVAAATVYAVVAMVVFWHTRSTVIRFVSAAVAVALPLIVGAARLYQGMHHLSDVVAGIVLGIVSILICQWILPPPGDALPYRLGSRRSVDTPAVSSPRREVTL